MGFEVSDLKNIIKCIICSYVVTGILLLLLAFLVYKMDLSENAAFIGINVVYVIAGFLGGFIMGKVKRENKYMWGAICASGYFLILVIVSLIVNQTIVSGLTGFFSTWAICASAGVVGGMVA